MADQASTWVSRFARLIPQGEVLDLACGSGRHSMLLASMGFEVIAVDRDPDLLAGLSHERITPLRFDLEQGDGMVNWPFKANRFSGIIVTNYLHRPLLPYIATSLAANGMLIYETFAQGNEHFGKPSNPDFLLATGELLSFAREQSLRVVAFEDGLVASPKSAMVQRICAVKADSNLSIERLRLI